MLPRLVLSEAEKRDQAVTTVKVPKRALWISVWLAFPSPPKSLLLKSLLVLLPPSSIGGFYDEGVQGERKPRALALG